MATEGGDKVGLKGKVVGPARLLQEEKTRKDAEGLPGEGGVSVAQEKVREEADICSNMGIQNTRESCSPNKEEREEGKSKGTRKPQKGVWWRVLSPTFTCFRRRRRRQCPESSSPRSHGEPVGSSDRAAKRKRRFPVPTWPPTIFRNLLTSGRGQGLPNVDPGEEGQLHVCRELTNCNPGVETTEEALKLDNNNDRIVLCLSEAGLDETGDRGRALGRSSDLNDIVGMEMSVQEPEAATESQLGCFGPAAEGYPLWPGLHGHEERLTDGSTDQTGNPLASPPSPGHDDLPFRGAATAKERLDDRAGPSDSSSEAEEATTTGLPNLVHQGGVGVAMVTNDHIAHCPPSVQTVVVVPVIRLNSGLEDGLCDWDAASLENSSLEDHVTAEVDWAGKAGGGGGGDGDGEAELVLCAHAVVQAAMLAAVQQLLREQQNCVDHLHHPDPHHLSPNPY